MQYSTWQSAGKGLKLHGGFWGPGGTCFAQVLKPSLNAVLRPGKARQRAMAKRWQGAKVDGFGGALVERASRRF